MQIRKIQNVIICYHSLFRYKLAYRYQDSSQIHNRYRCQENYLGPMSSTSLSLIVFTIFLVGYYVYLYLLVLCVYNCYATMLRWWIKLYKSLSCSTSMVESDEFIIYMYVVPVCKNHMSLITMVILVMYLVCQVWIFLRQKPAFSEF